MLSVVSIISAPMGRRCATRSFVLLEIILATLLLGTALTAMLRCFTSGLNAISRDRRVTQATLLAQGLLDDFEIEAPETDHVEGNFGPDFPGFTYTADFTSVEIKYRSLELRLARKEFEPLRQVEIAVFYTAPSTGKVSQVLRVTTFLTGIEKYSARTKSWTGMF
ncbi:MAG: hypothetical protein N3D11_12315 [Candidatus Sumerlaeia bacterium]|nr:hypothetical protein [Candidatus Sumerlaeia bacterium]